MRSAVLLPIVVLVHQSAKGLKAIALLQAVGVIAHLLLRQRGVCSRGGACDDGRKRRVPLAAAAFATKFRVLLFEVDSSTGEVRVKEARGGKNNEEAPVAVKSLKHSEDAVAKKRRVGDW